jgi:hypothetical protein
VRGHIDRVMIVYVCGLSVKVLGFRACRYQIIIVVP